MVPLLEIEVETWAPEKEIKKKKDKFLSPPVTSINFTENFPQTPVCKSTGKYKEQSKTDKFKKMGSSKIKENHSGEKLKKIK